MSRKNLFISFIALILGVFSGLYLKRFIETEVFNLIDDEARNSCKGCYIEKDSFEFSFLTLSGKGRNVRLKQGDQDFLVFDKVIVKAGISDIFDKKIHLDIDLIDGHSKGVGPDTPTFLFIDYLTTSNPNIDPNKSRWKAVVNNITVTRGNFTEEIGGMTLRGDNVGLTAHKIAENFILYPRVKKLSIEKVRKQGTPEESLFKYLLGEVVGTVDISDDYLTFKDFTLIREDAKLKFKGISLNQPGNKTDGEISFVWDAKSLGVDEYVRGLIQGTGTVTGKLGNPIVQAEVSNYNSTPLEVIVNNNTIASFDEFNGKIKTEKNPPEDRTLIVSEISGKNLKDRYNFTKDSNFTLLGEKTIGNLRFHLDEITAPQIVAKDIELLLSVSGELDNIITDFNATANEVTVLNQELGVTNANFSIKESLLKYTLKNKTDTLNSQGELLLKSNEQSHEVINFVANLSKLPLFSTYEKSKNYQLKDSEFGYLTGVLTAKGPLNIDEIISKGDLQFSNKKLLIPITSILKLNFGELKILSEDAKKFITAETTLKLKDDKKSNIKLKVNQFSLPELTNCSEVVAEANYNFILENYAVGDGEIAIKKGSFGCSPYDFNATIPKTLQIKNGVININDLKFTGLNTILNINGELNSFGKLKIKTTGDMNIGAFSSSLPAFDDVQGVVTINNEISGQLNDFSIKGSGKVKDLALRNADNDFEIQKVSGDILLNGDTITFKSNKGELNRGDLSIEGEINIKKKTSNILVNFYDSVYQPQDSIYASLNGKLNLTNLFQSPLIDGEVKITNAKLEKNFDLRQITDLLRNFAFESDRRAPEKINISALNPNTESISNPTLNIKINAERNIQVMSNWLESELKGDILVSGNLLTPKVTGKVESIDGWLGFKQRKFDITSAIVTFKESTSIPELDLLGESSIPTPTGELISVVLEAKGKLFDPKIRFSSDRGLTQKEILSMLISSGELTKSTDNRSLGFGVSYNDLSLINRDSTFLLGNFLYKITKIDKLSVEPAYNTLTGAVEPGVTAEKKLSDRFTAKGEGLFGTTSTQARGSINYQLSDLLNIAGGVESLGTERPVSLGIDLSYTALSSEIQSKTVNILSNNFFTKDEVLSFGGIRSDSIIESKDVSKIARDIEAKYRDSGFFNIKVQEDCQLSKINTDICEQTEFLLDEGKRATIDSYIIETTASNDADIKKENKKVKEKNFATKQFLDNTINETTEGLRASGYLASRVSGNYIFDDKINEPILKIFITLGQKYKFIFTGNKVYKSQDFIDDFGLYKRKQPFGSNTLSSFIAHIEKMYRNKGYLLASINANETIVGNLTEKNTPQKNIELVFNEESIVPVKEITISGNNRISYDELFSSVRKKFPYQFKKIFHPEFAIEEEILQSEQVFQSVLISKGFTEPKITHSLNLDDSGTFVTINYLIEEGEKVLITEVGIEGLPNEISYDAILKAKNITVPEVTELLSIIDDQLKENGYFSAKIDSSTSQLNSQQPNTSQLNSSYRLDIIVDPGPRTKFGEINFIGVKSTNKDIISSKIKFNPNEYWSEEKIADTKRSLLKLGLFSKVDIITTPSSNDPNTNNLEIRFVEKPLRTLQLGIGANSVFGTHFFGEAQDKSLFNDGKSLGFRSDLYYDPTKQEFSQGSANMLFSDPSFFGTDVSWIEDLRFQRLTILTQEFDVMRSSIGSFFFKNFGERLTASLGHSYAFENLSNVSEGAIFSKLDNSNFKLSTISGTLNYDRRDNSLVPTKGYTLSGDFKLSSEMLNSDANFAGAGFRASVIRPLSLVSDRLLFAANTRFSSQKAFGDTEQIPITQRYYLGGRTSIRGFRENSLGPRGDEGAVIGGDLLQAESFELQYLLKEDISIHTFLDMGNVFLKDYQRDYFDLRISSGAGFRYRSPVGPIGFDIGFPLDEKSGEPSARFHFSIGTNF